MNAPLHPELWQRARAQAAAVPAIYGNVDFDAQPYRFATAPDDVSTLPEALTGERPRVLADAEAVDLVRAYTMMGDIVADAYAALIPTYGLQTLIAMLVTACDKGIDAVADAPAELAAFIAHMERTPEWLDMALVEAGARHDRNSTANLSPFVIRGAFLATFPQQIFGAADGADRLAVERHRRAPRQGNRDVLRDHRAARRARTPRPRLQGGGDGAVDAFDGCASTSCAAPACGTSPNSACRSRKSTRCPPG
jgi:hypothetical protein